MTFFSLSIANPANRIAFVLLNESLSVEEA